MPVSRTRAKRENGRFIASCPCSILLFSSLIAPSLAAQTPAEFTVGNKFVSRTFGTEANQAFTRALRGRSEVAVNSAEFEVLCRFGGDEFVLNRFNTTPQTFSVSPDGVQAELVWRSQKPELGIHVRYRADGEHAYIFKWLEISNQGSEPVRILRASVERFEVAGGNPRRGGVGQPVFLGNELFLGIEHPAALNETLERGIVLSHFSYADLEPGKTWRSQRAVLGATVRADEPIEDAFRSYLVHLTRRPPNNEALYNDWGAHDELGTLVKPQLTEALTNELLDQLQAMKERDGTQFDAYVLDAFWYDPRGAYLTFKQANWPQGYEPALRRMVSLGMKPGLWFDLGASTLDLKSTPGWSGPEKPCLSDAAFRHLLEHAIDFHTREHRLSVLKFDFANLQCRGEDATDLPSLAVLERNAEGLKEVCDRARLANPRMEILAFNTFSRVEMMESTKLYDEAYAVSPWWLLWFDSLYSGDPRPSELPSVTSLRDSVNWYQDHVYRGFARCLLPLSGIDDCGTIIGKTSTIYYLGAEGFTDSWILNILRGTHAPTFYGDLRLLRENDRKFLAATLAFMRGHRGILAQTRPVLGIPGKAEVYGYLAQGENLGFLTVVNPGLFPQSFFFPLPPTRPAPEFEKVIFSNDGRLRRGLESSQGVLRGTLIPGEIRVYAFGERRKVGALSLPAAPTRPYHEVTPVRDPFDGRKEAEIPIRPANVGKTLAIVVQYIEAGEPARSFAWPQRVLKVEGTVGTSTVPFTSIPNEGADIWSKSSWAVFKHLVDASEANRRLHLELQGEPPTGITWRIQALWLK